MTSVEPAPSPVPAADDSAICVLVVTHNSGRDIEGLLRSLPCAGLQEADEVLVVDNASDDDTSLVVSKTGCATFLPTGANLGYSGAINHGRRARRTKGPLVVLNPDLRLEPGALAELRAALDDPEVGIAVPRMLAEDERLFHSLRREPTVRRALGDALLGRQWPRRPAWLSEVVWDDRQYEAAHDVDWATGAAMLVRPECDAAVGAWDDDRFFLYSEETDYARRARDLGYSVRYVPSAVVAHRGSGSGESPLLTALLVVNRVRYFEKFHGRAHAFLFRGVSALHELMRFWIARHRLALRYVLRRRSWSSLPSGSTVRAECLLRTACHGRGTWSTIAQAGPVTEGRDKGAS